MAWTDWKIVVIQLYRQTTLILGCCYNPRRPPLLSRRSFSDLSSLTQAPYTLFFSHPSPPTLSPKHHHRHDESARSLWKLRTQRFNEQCPSECKSNNGNPSGGQRECTGLQSRATFSRDKEKSPFPTGWKFILCVFVVLTKGKKYPTNFDV